MWHYVSDSHNGRPRYPKYFSLQRVSQDFLIVEISIRTKQVLQLSYNLLNRKQVSKFMFCSCLQHFFHPNEGGTWEGRSTLGWWAWWQGNVHSAQTAEAAGTKQQAQLARKSFRLGNWKDALEYPARCRILSLVHINSFSLAVPPIPGESLGETAQDPVLKSTTGIVPRLYHLIMGTAHHRGAISFLALQ